MKISSRIASFEARLSKTVLTGYVVALVGAVLAVWIRMELAGLFGPELPAYITFYPVVIMSALLGGTGAGVLATAWSGFLVDYFFFNPVHDLRIERPVDMAGLCIFILVNLMMSAVGGTLRKFHRRMGEQARQLARTVDLLNTELVERKAAEESLLRTEGARNMLAAIVADSDDAIIAKSLEGLITSWNRGAERLFGYSAEQMLGKDIRSLLPPDRPEEETRILNVKRRGEKVDHYEARRLTRDGRLIDVSITASPIRNPMNQVVGVSEIARDITERKRSEEAIRLRSAALRAAANGIAITNRTGTIEWVNDAFTHLTGYSAAEAIGQNPRVLKSGQHPAEFYAGMWSTVAGGRVWRGELVNKRKDGTLYHEEMTITPVCDESAAITHFIAVKQDVTVRKRLESNLLAIADLQKIMAVLASTADIMREACERIVKHLQLGHCLILEIGATEEQASVLHDYHPAGATALSGVYRLADLWNDAEQHELMAGRTLVSTQGRREWLPEANIRAAVGVPHLVAGRLKFVLVALCIESRAWAKEDVEFLTDLAARIFARVERARAEEQLRVSETQFRMLADTIPQLAWIARPDGHIFWYNQRWYDYTGTKPEQMEGWGWQSVHDPAELPKVMERWIASIASGEPFVMTFPLRSADGSFRPFLTRVTPLKDAAGRVVQWFGTNTDVNELKQAEEELEQRVRQRTAELKAANEELEAFCDSMAHDLRTPLRSIDGFSLAVLEDYGQKLDAEGQSHLVRIRKGCQWMGRLIDDLLKLSKVTRAPMIPERLNLTEMAQKIVVELRRLDPVRAVDFRITEGLAAKGDPDLIREALRQLLENAWKFTLNRTDPVIEFGVLHKQSETDSRSPPVFFVRDNGAGFEMTYAHKLFAPFQRLHSENEFYGAGIGLATVERILRRHGGRIWAEGTVGRGSIFQFTLNPNGPGL